MVALRSINESIQAGIGLTELLTPITVAGAALEWPASRLTCAAPFSCTYCSRQGGRRHLISGDRKSTRLNSSHVAISYAVFCLKKKKKINSQLIKLQMIDADLSYLIAT